MVNWASDILEEGFEWHVEVCLLETIFDPKRRSDEQNELLIHSLLFVVLVVLEEIYQARQQVNLWQVEERIVHKDSADIKFDKLVRIFLSNLFTKEEIILEAEALKNCLHFHKFEPMTAEQYITKTINL